LKISTLNSTLFQELLMVGVSSGTHSTEKKTNLLYNNERYFYTKIIHVNFTVLSNGCKISTSSP